MIQLDLNMKMPDKCSECKFFRVHNRLYCTAVVGYTTVSKPRERRPAWCPLHEITDTDTISRQAVIELIQGSICDLEYSDENRELCNKVRALPPSPSRPKGRWKTIAFLTAECSECHAQIHELEYGNFCPNCGADMRL